MGRRLDVEGDGALVAVGGLGGGRDLWCPVGAYRGIGLAGVDNLAHKQRTAPVSVSRMMYRNGWSARISTSGPAGTLVVLATMAVTAAASVPSSSTITFLSWFTRATVWVSKSIYLG